MSSYQEFHAFALQLAGAATPLALEPVRQGDVEQKRDTTFVTSTDRNIQSLLVERICQAYPEHAILAEESSGPAGSVDPMVADYCWVLDPIDGTRNYVGGLECYAISIGLMKRGSPVVGVVVEPNIGKVYSATDGGGAWRIELSKLLEGTSPFSSIARNDAAGRVEQLTEVLASAKHLRVVDPEVGGTALVAFTSNRDPVSLELIKKWAASRGIVLRNMGTTAYHLALVASGAFAACFSRKCKIWDIAAGSLLVKEAGGNVTSADGGDLYPYDLNRDPEDNLPILAGGSRTHEWLQELGR